MDLLMQIFGGQQMGGSNPFMQQLSQMFQQNQQPSLFQQSGISPIGTRSPDGRLSAGSPDYLGGPGGMGLGMNQYVTNPPVGNMGPPVPGGQGFGAGGQGGGSPGGIGAPPGSGGYGGSDALMRILQQLSQVMGQFGPPPNLPSGNSGGAGAVQGLGASQGMYPSTQGGGLQWNSGNGPGILPPTGGMSPIGTRSPDGRLSAGTPDYITGGPGGMGPQNELGMRQYVTNTPLPGGMGRPNQYNWESEIPQYITNQRGAAPGPYDWWSNIFNG
jgi:hypothetical protein